MKVILILLVCSSILSAQNLTFNPNPFNGRGLISFTLTSNDTVTLEVVDITGQIAVTVYSNSPLNAAVYNDSLIMTNHPDGIYFLIFKTKKGFTQNSKLLKVLGTGLSENSNTLHLAIYPNPVNTLLTVRNQKSEKLTLTLVDVMGENLLETIVFETDVSLDMSEFAAGIYYLKVESDNQRACYKVLKHN